MIRNKIKNKIIASFYANIHTFQRQSAIIEDLREFIYDENGNYIEGGEEIADYISNIQRKACLLEQQEPDYTSIF